MIPFVGTYVVAAAINIVGAALFLALDLPKPAPPAADAPAGRSRVELLKDPRIAVAIICGMVSLRADEPDDDLDAAGHGRMRLFHRHGG